MTTDARHSKATPTNIGVHVSQAFEYANAAARTGAAGLTADDVGKIARQTDNESFWVLTDHSPVTWSALDSSSVLSSTAPVDVTKAAASAGSAGDASRRDHKHDVSTAAAGSATPGDSASEGVATSLARSDHRHALPAFGSTSATFCEGNDSRLSDARTPTAHATTHQSGGSDPIKLDDFATPDDNTDLDASTSRHGLLLKLGGGTTNFLRADGTWSAPGSGVFGSEYDYQEKTTLQSTSSTSWQQYTRLTTSSLPAGTYRIGWMYVWNYSDPADEWMARLQVDDTTDLINPGDATYPYQRHELPDGGIDQRYYNAGFRHVTLTAGVHDIDLDFRSDEAADTARMYHGQIEIWRVS